MESQTLTSKDGPRAEMVNIKLTTIKFVNVTSDLVLYFIISAVQYLPFVFAPVFYTYLRNI